MMKRAKSENDDVERQPYLSGAYIRSFVKQLSSSSSSSSRNCSSSGSSMREKAAILERRETSAAVAVAVAEGNPQKKQVRRRLQTRKPYQEKLLNMAEARREIVTALKLHRAAMNHHHHHHHQEQIMEPAPDFQKSRRNPRIYAAVDFPGNDVARWSVPPPLPPPPETLDFALPSQALGLNLNLHDFVTVPSSSIYSSSSPSTSSSSPPPPHATAVMLGGGAGDGERFEFLEVGGGEEEREEEVVRSPFDEVMEFPPWLNANESCLQHVDSPDFFHASVLPCMEIEEIEGMDGDWLA